MDCSEIKPGPMVYFAEVENVIKIGVSSDPNERMEQLRYKTGKSFTIIGLMHGGYEAETHMHRKFKEYRLYGEYFSRAIGLMDFIDDLGSGRACYGCVHDLGVTNILQNAIDATTKRVIREAIDMVGNSNTAISARLGMSRRNVYRVRRRLGV